MSAKQTISPASANAGLFFGGRGGVCKLADLIVIDRDYLTCPVEDIAQTRVLMTIVGGHVVYEAAK
jgi:predicted amidohydrolase YtcJ